MINKEMLEQDTKDRLNTVNDIIHNCISMKVKSVDGLKESYKNKDLKDEDFIRNREESRILLNDIQNVINNFSKLGIDTKKECITGLGEDIISLEDLLNSAIKMMMYDRKDFSATKTPKIYKLLNNAIENYLEAIELLEGYFNKKEIIKCSNVESYYKANRGLYRIKSCKTFK